MEINLKIIFLNNKWISEKCNVEDTFAISKGALSSLRKNKRDAKCICIKLKTQKTFEIGTHRYTYLVACKLHM